MDYNAIATAIESTANTLPGMNAYDYVPDDLANVGLYVGEIDIELNITMRGKRATGGPRRGSDQATITVRVLVAKYDDRSALKKLREYMGGSGPMSLVDALEQNNTLDGTVDDSRVVSMRGNRLFDVGASKFYGVELDLFVIGDA